MNLYQKQVLSENFQFLANHLRIKEIVECTRRRHPNVIRDGDIFSINIRKQEAKASYLLDLFRKTPEGYNKLYEVLKATGHSHTVLKVLEKERQTREEHIRGATMETPKPNGHNRAMPEEAVDPMELVLKQLRSMSMKLDKMDNQGEVLQRMEKLSFEFNEFRSDMRDKIDRLQERFTSLEKALSSDEKVQNTLKESIKALTEEFKKFQKDCESLNENRQQTDSFEHKKIQAVLEKLNELSVGTSDHKGDIWREIHELRKGIDSLKESSVVAERHASRRSETDPITEEDIHEIVKKIKPIWLPLAEKLGVELESTQVDKHAVLGEEKAGEVINGWLKKRADDTTFDKTWKDLYEMLSTVDQSIADDVDHMR